LPFKCNLQRYSAARAELDPLVDGLIDAIQELQDELMVQRDGPDDPLHAGVALRPSSYSGGRTEVRRCRLNQVDP
jgi:hypothetical protein